MAKSFSTLTPLLRSSCHLICIPRDGVLPFSRMLKVPPETKAGYECSFLSVSEVGTLSQNVNICPDHRRFIIQKCHICILLESQLPPLLSAKIHNFTARLEIWEKACRHSKPQSINRQLAIKWLLQQSSTIYSSNPMCTQIKQFFSLLLLAVQNESRPTVFIQPWIPCIFHFQ